MLLTYLMNDQYISYCEYLMVENKVAHICWLQFPVCEKRTGNEKEITYPV